MIDCIACIRCALQAGHAVSLVRGGEHSPYHMTSASKEASRTIIVGDWIVLARCRIFSVPCRVPVPGPPWKFGGELFGADLRAYQGWARFFCLLPFSPQTQENKQKMAENGLFFFCASQVARNSGDIPVWKITGTKDFAQFSRESSGRDTVSLANFTQF